MNMKEFETEQYFPDSLTEEKIVGAEGEIPEREWKNLQIIAQRVGGDFRMEVKLGEPGGGSFFNPEDGSITLKGDTGKIKFEEKTLTRKEFFDILVARASVTEEDKERLEEERRRILEQSKRDAEDAINNLIDHPDIPESIKSILQDSLT